MFQKPEFNYTMTVQAENMFARVYVNGAPLINHLRGDKLLFTYQINRYLRAGNNTIEIDYEPLNIPAQTFTAHDGVALQVELRQRNQSGAVAVDLVSARFDPEVQELTSRSNRVFGDTPVTRHGGSIVGSDTFMVSPVDMNFEDRASSPDTRRVSVSFQLNDTSQGQLPWETAPILSDTPEMRKALWESYKVLHDASARKNADAYLTITDPMMQRIAYTLGYEKTSDLAQSIWEFSPLGGPAGSTVGPLPSLDEFMKTHLRWSADRRMVRAQHSPVIF